MKVERLPETLTISVTEEDIDKGIGSDCNRCPVALAIARTYPGYVVDCAQNFIFMEHLEDLDYHRVYHTPEVVVNFMDDFDGDWTPKEELEPFTFTANEREPSY